MTLILSNLFLPTKFLSSNSPVFSMLTHQISVLSWIFSHLELDQAPPLDPGKCGPCLRPCALRAPKIWSAFKNFQRPSSVLGLTKADGTWQCCLDMAPWAQTRFHLGPGPHCLPLKHSVNLYCPLGIMDSFPWALGLIHFWVDQSQF